MLTHAEPAAGRDAHLLPAPHSQLPAHCLSDSVGWLAQEESEQATLTLDEVQVRWRAGGRQAGRWLAGQA